MNKAPVEYKEVIGKYGGIIKGAIKNKVGDNPDADDIYQNICLSIFLSIKNFSGRSGIGTYIYPIMMRRVADYFRGKAAKGRIERAAMENAILSMKKVETQSNPAPKKSGMFLVSKRQMDVLALIACGHSNKEIASSLNISIHTVRSHIKALNKKYKFDNRVRMALALNKFFEGGTS